MNDLRNTRFQSTIVPGRRIIPEVIYRDAGIEGEPSYLAERTMDESVVNCTVDMEERMWRKQGVPEAEIFRRQEERTLQKHAQARARLQKEKFGAKTFGEMCALSEYSARESEDEDDGARAQERKKKKENVFAIPTIPRHLNEKSILGPPSVHAKGSGKAGLSCSTPKGNKDLSMQSLRILDISHVVNTDRLDNRKTTSQEKTVVIPVCVDDESSLQKTHTIQKEESQGGATFTVAKNGEDGSLQGTFTLEKNGEEGSLQGTFTKGQNQSASLQGTFIKETDPTENQQGTFIVQSAKDQTESMHGTSVKTTEEDPEVVTQLAEEKTLVQISDDVPTANETIQGGERRKSKKIGLGEREKRVADLTSSLMSSMIEDIPSPGAHFFKNNRKKMRATVATPPRSKLGANRLSTESDKEKTIDMLSIAEELTIEANGSSYVEPVSVNGSRVSPIPEDNEAVPMEISVTPKSSRRPVSSLRQEAASSIEKGRRQASLMRISMNPMTSVHSPIAEQTPSKNYLKPTFSSIAKHKTPSESNELLEAEKMNRRRTPVSTPTKNRMFEDIDVPEEFKAEEGIQRPAVIEYPEGPEDPTLQTSNRSLGNVADDMNALSVTDNRPSASSDVQDHHHSCNPSDDYYPDDEAAAPMFEDEEEEEEDRTRKPKKKQTRRRVALLSDSIATVNTPGLEDRRAARSRRYGGAQSSSVANSPSFDYSYEQEPRYGRKKKQVEMMLAKRELIAPETPTDGIRRSKRTRVKPLRTWLGETAEYQNSPSGGKRLVGVKEVIIKDKRLCKYRTADLNLAMQRESREKALKRARAAERRRQLAVEQSFGRRMNESQEDIVTSDDE